MRLLCALLLGSMAALPAGAVIHDRADPQANTTPPPDDPGFGNVGNVGGLSAVYLGNGWVISAAHVATGPVVFDENGPGVPPPAASYPPLANSRVQLQPEGGASLPPDLVLWRLIQPWPSLPALEIRAPGLGGGEPLVMIGNGATRTGTTTWVAGAGPPKPGYTYGGAHDPRWGTNAVEGFPAGDPWLAVGGTETHAFSSRFDCSCVAAGGDEAVAVNGDSGGGVFIHDGGGWQLAGIMFANSLFFQQPDDTVVEGNLTWSADLSVYRDQILPITAPAIPALPSWGVPALGALLLGAGVSRLRRRRPGG